MFNEALLFETLTHVIGTILIPDLIHIIAVYAYEFKCRWEAPFDGTYQISNEGKCVEVLVRKLTVIMGTMALPKKSIVTWNLVPQEYLIDLYVGIASKRVTAQDLQKDYDLDTQIRVLSLGGQLFHMNFRVDFTGPLGTFECADNDCDDHGSKSVHGIFHDMDLTQNWYPFIAFQSDGDFPDNTYSYQVEDA